MTALFIRPPLALAAGISSFFLLAGCDGSPAAMHVSHVPEDARAEQLETMKELMTPPTPTPTLTMVQARPALLGRGFAQVAGQPGTTVNERRLLAMRAARLEAMRDLTEQIHGIRISSDSLVRDAVLRNDSLAAHVQGTLYGARTVSIEPKGEDGYSVVLELDADTVEYVVRAARSGA